MLGIFGGAGGGIVGSLGYNLTAADGDRWSSQQQTTMYAIGGGLILTGALLGLVWPDPADEFAETYNCLLRRELGGRCKARKLLMANASGAWLPTTMTPAGVAWTFE